MDTWKECVFLLFLDGVFCVCQLGSVSWRCCWVPAYSWWLSVQLFYQLLKGVLYPALTVNLSISPFSFLIYFLHTLQFCCLVYKYLRLLCFLGAFILLSIWNILLSLVNFFALKFALSNINTFFSILKLIFMWNIFSPLLPFLLGKKIYIMNTYWKLGCVKIMNDQCLLGHSTSPQVIPGLSSVKLYIKILTLIRPNSEVREILGNWN